MKNIKFYIASEKDIPFILETYKENIDYLHGNNRDYETWKSLLSQKESTYYIVEDDEQVAWFRSEIEDNTLWLGMLQVSPKYKRQGYGKSILLFIEELAKENNINMLGIHTTEDNIPARSLYELMGYEVIEVGECTTADGVNRIGYTFSKNIKK